MSIPGLKPSFEVRAKVRIGEKKKVQTKRGEMEVPSSVDYFICDDADFTRVVGEGAKQLRVFLPFEKAEDNFPTGLEQWAGKMLVCYAKGDEQDGRPVAFRKATMKQDGQTVDLLRDFEVLSDEAVGQDRRRVVCPVRDCAILKKGDCKPMGRLQFFIDGIDRRAGVYQLDTKSWNSIENLEATLSLFPDLRNVPFVLRVEFTQRGRDRFPELYLEADVDVDTDADIGLADRLIQLDRMLSHHRDAGEDAGEPVRLLVRSALANVLDLTNPGWRNDEVVVNWIKEQGVVAASSALLRRHLT